MRYGNTPKRETRTRLRYKCDQCGKRASVELEPGEKVSSPASLPPGWTQKVELLYHQTYCDECSE